MANLTASEIIALLLERPGCCGVLNIDADRSCGSYGNDVFLFHDDDDEQVEMFRRWLTGALVEAHVERGIDLPTRWTTGWTVGDRFLGEPNETTYHPTLLHALLAGLESNLKETTK